MHCLHFMQCPLVANWKEQWFINGPLIQNTFAKILGRICYPYVEHSINLLNIGLIRIIPTRTLILTLGTFLAVDLGRVRREPFSRNPKPPRRRRHGRHRRLHLARRVRVRKRGRGRVFRQEGEEEGRRPSAEEAGNADHFPGWILTLLLSDYWLI